MYTIAISSLKGGVGKTTTTFHLAAALAEAGHSVLAIDADPQACLTDCFRAEPDPGAGLAEVLCGKATVATAAVRTRFDNVWLLAASSRLEMIHRRNLAGDRVLQARMARTCDFVLIDCPSAPGVLLGNALIAADSVLVPVAPRAFARGAIGRVVAAVRDLRDRGAHRRLDVLGLLVNQFDPRSKLAAQVEAEVRQRFGSLVFDTRVHDADPIGEATERGEPITTAAPGSRAAEEFRAAASELAARAASRAGFFGSDRSRHRGSLRMVAGGVD